MRDDRSRPTRLRERRRPSTAHADGPEDPLEVPKWAHPKVTAYDLEPEDRKRELRQRQVRTTQRALPARDGYLIGMAIAPGATSIVALAVAAVPLLSGSGDIPAGIVLVLLMQVAAIAILGQIGLGQWTPSWIAVG
ncbi:MAG: hypothetical protein M3Y37_04705, partial [Chloroflexota bacterium]|nr:hypothetical protein [Chloroflexota bacterium]